MDDLKPDAHFEIGASSAPRWRHCPGSRKLSRGLPDKARFEAAEGTVFHEIAAECIATGKDPYGDVGRLVHVEGYGTLPFTEEMADYMLAGLDYIRDLIAEPGVYVYVEQRLDISPWLGFDEKGHGGFGWSDCCIVDVLGKRIIVFDWKYGAGIVVDANWNDQGIIYALGCWNTFAEALFGSVYTDLPMSEIEVQIVIEQPRAPGGGGVWTTDMATLLAEGHKITIDAAATEDPDAPLNPSLKACQWCRARENNVCPAYAASMLDKFDLGLEEAQELAEDEAAIPLPTAVTPEVRGWLLLHRSAINKWLDQLHAEAYDDAIKGRPTPHQKLVDGRSPKRVWKDEDKAKFKLERRYGYEAYSRKLLSPAQTESREGKKKFREVFGPYVRQDQPQPILVPEYDRREAKADKTSLFDDL